MNKKIKGPRNPLVAQARFRAAGAHGKTKKALRRHAQMQMAREIKGGLDVSSCF